MQQQKPAEIIDNFLIKGIFINAKSHGNGHINDTYLISTTSEKYILQKLNHNIFKNIDELNQNIIKALDHFKKKQKENPSIKKFMEPEIILCKNGNNHFKDKQGNYWRLMNFISGSTSLEVAEKPEMAFEAAKAFGYFQQKIIDLNPDDFFPIIKDFHNLEMRMKAFYNVLEKDTKNRNQFASEEIEFVKSHEHLSIKLKELLESRQIPIRVAHNDTKINNVLLDKKTLKGISVIDLDTIMPGTILFDFGDMVRTFTSPAEEDETDLSKVVLRLEIFEAMAKGYLSQLKEVLTKTEIDNLVFGGKIMTFMIGLRFLTDFLEGDIYFKTSRNNHNLDRCRTQFKLLTEIENKEDILKKIINESTTKSPKKKNATKTQKHENPQNKDYQ
ncbi:MAG: aminoglycoside phosphotransferase family protein [Bacteroidales bacterium]|nr:aminoglycoside phosphotransferase family protein [Bacteroidales bacterium]